MAIDEFLTPEWAARYQNLWNNDAELTTGLKGFTALIEYGWIDEPKPSIFLEVTDGRVTAIHPTAPRTPDFEMKATRENWQRMLDGTLSGRAALLTKKLKFKGSMITAMRYMGPFEKSIALLSKA